MLYFSLPEAYFILLETYTIPLETILSFQKQLYDSRNSFKLPETVGSLPETVLSFQKRSGVFQNIVNIYIYGIYRDYIREYIGMRRTAPKGTLRPKYLGKSKTTINKGFISPGCALFPKKNALDLHRS